MVEILHNKYQVPVFSIEDLDNISKVLNSKEFKDIYSFYASQIPDSSRLEQIPDFERMLGFYLYYTGQDQFLDQLDGLLYKKKLPTIQEFMKQPEYMGNSYAEIYQYWRDVLSKIFDPTGGIYECLSGDTKIDLLDGTSRTIQDIYEHCETTNLWVYTWNEKTHTVEPGQIEEIMYSGEKEVLEITLDNGERIVCTPTHKFLTRDNKWKEAGKLKAGDSLMPFERFVKTKENKYSDGLSSYEMINIPQKDGTIKTEYTHRLSAFWKYGRKYKNPRKTRYGTKYEVIHHKDGNKYNNNPTNLIMLDKDVHLKYHTNFARQSLSIFTNRVQERDPEAIEIVKRNGRKGLISRWSQEEYHLRASAKLTQRNLTDGYASKISLKRWNSERAEQDRILARERLTKRNYENNPSKRDDISEELLWETIKDSFNVTQVQKKLNCSRGFITNHTVRKGDHYNKHFKVATKENVEEMLSSCYTFEEAEAKFNLTNFWFKDKIKKFNIKPEKCFKNNHKIVSIKHLKNKEKVYDVCIRGNHNFAINSSTYTKNCILRGAIGIGKSSIARRALLYVLYRVCCLRNPHRFFGIEYSTVISVIMISITLDHAENTQLKPMLELLRNTPCFHEVRKMTSFSSFGPKDPVPYCRQGKKIIFPNNIMLTVGSNNNHVVGMSPVGSSFDEAEEKNQEEAFSLYSNIRERIRSRFMGSSLTFCALMSSSKSKSGMVWEYINKIKPEDKETLLLDPAQWEVKKDAFTYSGKKFWIYIGTKTHPSRILPHEYDNVPLEKLEYVPPAGCDLLEVPIEYLRDFENNIEGAIQNLAGKTTDTSDRPFDDLSLLGNCPNLLPEVHLEAPLGDPIPLINKLPKDLFQETTLGPRLARYPNAPRFVHVDLASQSTSQAGYSLWHKEYIVNEVGERVTVFVADFISWITAPNRIDHDAIKQLSLDLRDKAGVYIKTISYDQFQCFTGDTKVSLLNGEDVSFKEILERFNNGEELYTYTLDLDNKKVVPGKIINAKNNGKKQIMKVVLDNDEEIKCTLDHRFMLRDGTFVQAQNLKSGDSLMPLYRKYSNKGYEIMLNPLTNSWGLTYGKIANYMYGHIKGLHIHHKDFNKLNNNPNNLVLLTKEEHFKKHVDHFHDLLKADPNIWNKIREKSQTEEARKKRSIKCKRIKEKFYADKTKSAYARRRQSESGKLISKKYKQEMINCTKKSFRKDNGKRAKEQSERITILNKTIKPRLGTKTTDIAIQNITRANLLKWKSPEYVAKMKVRYPGARGHLIKLFGKNYKKTVSLEIINEEKKKHREEWFKTHRINHKVKRIEILNEYDYVYDISIDKIQNFALSAGVFVHNSEYVRQSLQQHHEFENVKYQSVDRDISAYLNFAQWIISGRIKVGKCPYLKEQLGHIGIIDRKIVTTRKKDMSDSCLAYDTKVFLLSGKILTVEELYNSNIEHEWVLACDVNNKKLVPVKIEDVLQKHIPSTLIQFTLSNGKTLSVTDDHLILMKNGKYKRADEIEQFDELMPFNYYHELNYHDKYRKVVNPFKGTAKFLYKIVSQELLSEAIKEAKNRALNDGSKFTVIHHKSHNKNDDRPENLVPLTNIEHTNLHAMTGKEIKAFHDRTVLKRERSKIINEGLALMKKVNPEGYRRYLLKHDMADKLAEQKAKVENLKVYVTQITRVDNDKPVYDIVLNSIHNFALDCNVFVHNCVGSVNNAYLDATPVEYPFIDSKKQDLNLNTILGIDDSQEIVEV